MDLPPAPNGLSNRWNLGLRWGLCSAPGCIFRDNLLKCSGCHAILYCSVAHQKADRPRHKSSCNIVKGAREDLAKEEAALRATPGDAQMPENPFETARGQFWLFRPTRSYMQSRLALTAALLNIKTGVAVETALDHSLEMLQLNPGDNQGVRGQVPGLLLRLGRDQEAYDFIKWYATVGAASDYKWGNPESPFLNLHDEDVFERVDEYAEKVYDLSMLVCLTNLKIRLLLDLQALERESKKPGNSDASYDKKMEWVREEAVSDALYKRRDIVERADWTDLIADLEGQIKTLVGYVEKKNKHYWPALNVPERWAAAYPAVYSPGSPQEINMVFRQTWYTWSECPTTMEVLKKYAGI
ncbi:hypothetical protein F4820DRAFT_412812 [Hypoxylon rubiginosum]|uniref:Uncharacterized protein n=1 Tax=Hypoxylon rubiginosum TaxID=110542 RepID=A0ACB9Z772_9PEZI|nr:hypothetical protein F4820DRAFT_412812 [Hypoxylon rubiginosum]